MVQVEDSDEEIGPALPGEETRKPTEEALLQVRKKREESEQGASGKKLVCFGVCVESRSVASG